MGRWSNASLKIDVKQEQQQECEAGYSRMNTFAEDQRLFAKQRDDDAKSQQKGSLEASPHV